MKCFNFLYAFIFLLAACTPTKNLVKFQEGIAMQFDKRHIDLGKVKKGEKREIFYELTNVGTETLEIDIISSCHCTTLDYATVPIPSGGKLRINAVFDSTEKEKSEDVNIDIIFKNTNPKTGYPLVEQLIYHFDLVLP